MPDIDFPNSLLIPPVNPVTGLESWPVHSPTQGLSGLAARDIRSYVATATACLFTEITSKTFPADANTITTTGFSVEGKGQATYRRWAAPMSAPIGDMEGYSWAEDSTGAQWMLDNQAINPYMFGALGGYATLAEAQSGVEDTTPINKMFAHFATYPMIVASLANRYWKSTKVRVAHNQLNRQANWIAGAIVAPAGSSGDNLVEISTRYGQWYGKLSAYGTGGVSYASRTWNCGIYFDDTSRVAGGLWEAENFQSFGLFVAQDKLDGGGNKYQNNISAFVSNGRAVNCGSVFGTATAFLSTTFTLTAHSVVGNGSTGQFSTIALADSVPTQCYVGSIVYIPYAARTTDYISNGVDVRFKVDNIYSFNQSFTTVTINGVVKAKGDGWNPVPTNHIELEDPIPAGQTISITTKPYEPYQVKRVGVNELDVYPKIPNDYVVGTGSDIAYGFGAGVRNTGSNSASTRFGPVECLRVAAGIIAEALYAGQYDGLQVQASTCGIIIGNLTSSASYAPYLGLFHAESNVFDYIFVSTSGKRFIMPTFSAMGVRTVEASEEPFGQIFCIAPRMDTGELSPTHKGLDGVTLFDGKSLIPPRTGPISGTALTTVTLSPYPSESRIVQRNNTTSIKLKSRGVLDNLMGGYNYIEFSLFGTGTGGGPTGNTTIAPTDLDLEDGYTVMGGASLVIPSSQFPLHGVAMLDSLTGGKNWVISYTNYRTNVRVDEAQVAFSVAANSKVDIDIAVPNTTMGDTINCEYTRTLAGCFKTHSWLSDDVIRITVVNITGALINIAAGTWKIQVVRLV